MAINCNTNTAPAATTTHKKVKIDRPPPMLPHTPNEFKFAERVLQKMVLDSEFFPKRAASDDWFKSIHHRPNRGKSGSGSSLYYNSAVPQTPAATETPSSSRRQSSTEDASSVATASTSNSVSSSEQDNTNSNSNSSSPFPRCRSLADLSLLDQERLDMPFAIRSTGDSPLSNSNHGGSNSKHTNNSLGMMKKKLHGSANNLMALGGSGSGFTRRASVDNAQLNNYYVPAAPIPIVEKTKKEMKVDERQPERLLEEKTLLWQINSQQDGTT